MNTGLSRCYFNLDPVESQCGAGKSADFSTPSFDQRFDSFKSILQKLNQERLLSVKDTSCGPFNINRGLSTYEPKYINFSLFSNNGSELAPYLSEVIKVNVGTVDPMANQQDRWACYSPQLENCVGVVVQDVESNMLEFSASDYFKVISEPKRLILSYSLPQSMLGQIKYLYIEDEAGELKVISLNKAYGDFVYKVKNSGKHTFYFADEYGDQIGKASLIFH